MKPPLLMKLSGAGFLLTGILYWLPVWLVLRMIIQALSRASQPAHFFAIALLATALIFFAALAAGHAAVAVGLLRGKTWAVLGALPFSLLDVATGVKASTLAFGWTYLILCGLVFAGLVALARGGARRRA